MTTTDSPPGAALSQAAQPVDAVPDAPRPKSEPKQSRHAAQLVRLMQDANLFHTPDLRGHATVFENGRRLTLSLKSDEMGNVLQNRFYHTYGRVPSQRAVEEALGVLEGKARFTAPLASVAVRVAAHDGDIHVNLGDAAGRVVEITASGWHVIGGSPARFVQPRGASSLPVPTPYGLVRALRPFLNLGSEADFRLIVGWLVDALRPDGPHAILVLYGEQGSGKSIATRVLRSLIDPHEAAVRSPPEMSTTSP